MLPWCPCRCGTLCRGCLVVKAPHLCDGPLVTNDIAELSPTPALPSREGEFASAASQEKGRLFRILGRRDNVVCSGGIKLQMEAIEEKLRPAMGGIPFVTTKVKDDKFGEAVVLLVEGPKGALPHEEQLFAALTKYERPKHVIPVPRLPTTETGKPARAAAARLAEEWV